MRTAARVVVIGGGIVGCSVLHHLARLGWGDIVLVERNELTAGSTWHAAGNCPNFSTSYNVMRLQAYSNSLYRRLPQETGYPIDHRQSGSIRLAHNAERMAEFHHVASMAGAQGLALAFVRRTSPRPGPRSRSRSWVSGERRSSPPSRSTTRTTPAFAPRRLPRPVVDGHATWVSQPRAGSAAA
jgi:glycine/D-amino acid oxidase-like deaminating enzyme